MDVDQTWLRLSLDNYFYVYMYTVCALNYFIDLFYRFLNALLHKQIDGLVKGTS